MLKKLIPLCSLFTMALIPSKLWASEVFTEGAQRVYGQQSKTDLDYRSMKVGGSHSGTGWGMWGELERFYPENYKQSYGLEVAGIKSLGPINLQGAYGTSDDYRFKASRLYLLEVQLPLYGIGLTPFIGHSREEYFASTTNSFRYYKMGAVKNLGGGFSLLAQYQYIDNKNKALDISKIGSQIAATLNYNTDGYALTLGGQFSCIGRNTFCNQKNSRDEYFEGNLGWKWKGSDTFGFRSQLSYIYQKSFIIQDKSSEIGRSSWVLRLGPQFSF